MLENKNFPFKFEPPLVEGLIRRRRNRFIMEVDVNGVIYDCHCPTTGRIGNISFRDIPCLLSKSKDSTRKTLYTVEAISLEKPSDVNKSWIGINQNAANRYVEHFLKSGQLSDMVSGGELVKREQKLGNSKLDFLVGNTYIEVKTPLVQLQIELKEHIDTAEGSDFTSFERFIKHIGELAGSLNENDQAILLVCFIYDSPRFIGSSDGKHSSYIRENVQSSIQQGVEVWQINFKITPTEVNLIRYFETTRDIMDE
ncbi:sugar fermentation stimulation protein [Paenibacillus sp. FSL R7-0273]|uniref:DNA/RNA nuclease SfsA n=1 Tax=Paenibacillus sp. FSL R7-0273 TaxID=1536772 RepID=UPI0004F5ACD4|nr:DNA/RNA nuclease SfsA [Paenibacillus sp. FSL R7-0273]AIQ48586.1 sugar fermentation stimulation protein [Paenibacillus sp. FSL R7-0273]OMF94072.1 sugar fermentation stimulation protein [Paenibacillus sp. FSL R7-0273]